MPKPNHILEGVLQDINKTFISIANKTKNNVVLKQVMDDFMVEFNKDPLYNSIYERHFFGGSYYDDLKVGSPDEFDIDFVFTLPRNATAKILTDDNYPGFVQVKLTTLDLLKKITYPPKYEDVKKIVDDENYLSIRKIKSWFQRLVIKAKNTLDRDNPWKDYSITKIENGDGPAMTFKITDSYGNVFDVDFVPCFKFTRPDWPSNCKTYPKVDAHAQLLNEFFVVPKQKDACSNTYFRLSFQGQERDIITDKGHLKPAIKLLKYLRDVYYDSTIKSYYIKTIAIWAIENKTLQWNKQSLSSTFLQLLQHYINAIENEEIPYYWNSALNLLDGCRQIYLQNLKNQLEVIRKVCNEQKDEASIKKIFKVATPVMYGECAGQIPSTQFSDSDNEVSTITNNFASFTTNDGAENTQEQETGSSWGWFAAASIMAAGAAALFSIGAARTNQNNN